MAYTPPNGNNVKLDFGGDYSPPNGNNVNLNFSDANYKDRSISIGLVLSKPVISVSVNAQVVKTVSINLVLNKPVIHAEINAIKTSQATVSLILNKPVIAIAVNAAMPPVDEASLTISLVLNKPVISIIAEIDTNIPEYISNSCNGSWQTADIKASSHQIKWQQAEHYLDDSQLSWAHAEIKSTCVASVFDNAAQERKGVDISWQQADTLSNAVTDQFANLDQLRLMKDVTWQQAYALSVARNDKFKDLTHLRAISTAPWGIAQQLAIEWKFKFCIADWINTVNYLIWQNAQIPPIGRSPANHIDPPKPPEYQGSTLLNFACEMCCVDPLNVVLNFGEEPCPANHRAIYIVNEIYMKRVSDDADVQVFNAQLGIDTDSWCWSFTATIPKSELPKVHPSNEVEVELGVNGFQWRFLVEFFDEDKEFANSKVTIRGRSVTAYLDAPYAATRSYTQIEQAWSRALAENELSRNGEVSPFSLDWQLIDDLGWNVPNNTFSYSNLTPIAAIKTIAESVGGFVNSDPFAKTLHILPTYKFPSWDIDAQVADRTINYDFITHEGFQWNKSPMFNGIYVSGENTGVTALVKRTGTAGDEQMQMVVDQLIVDDPSARQRGIHELSKGGKQATVSIDLPITAETGLLTPGMLIDFEVACAGSCEVDIVPWRGIVRGISIAAQEAKVIQTVEFERRFDE